MKKLVVLLLVAGCAQQPAPYVSNAPAADDAVCQREAKVAAERSQGWAGYTGWPEAVLVSNLRAQCLRQRGFQVFVNEKGQQ